MKVRGLPGYFIDDASLVCGFRQTRQQPYRHANRNFLSLQERIIYLIHTVIELSYYK